MSNAERLAAYIRNHSIPACVTPWGDLAGLAQMSNADGYFEEWETIEPTLEAVRDWLGY